MPKIGFIGAGNVGATAANYAARDELGDVVLVDIKEGMPQGKALDMSESRPIANMDPNITGTNDYDDIEGCDLFVVTAGLPRKPGMTREDLLQKNAEIIEGIGEEIRDKAPESKIIMVTNPLDVMTYLMREVTGFPAERVIGQAGVLDSARFSYFIANELDVSAEDVDAMVLGGHGDSMVPLPRYTTVSGISVEDLIEDEDRLDEMVERTRGAGGEIVDLLGDGSAFYAPAAAVNQMARSILKDKKRILPCSVYADGQYGLEDVYIGLPAKLGENGVEEIIELDLEDEEYESLEESAEFYGEQIDIALDAVSV
jgi:malate dehydrogenase